MFSNAGSESVAIPLQVLATYLAAATAPISDSKVVYQVDLFSEALFATFTAVHPTFTLVHPLTQFPAQCPDTAAQVRTTCSSCGGCRVAAKLVDLGGAVSVHGFHSSSTQSCALFSGCRSSHLPCASHARDASRSNTLPASAHPMLSGPEAAKAALARALCRKADVDGASAAGGVGFERWRARMLRRGQLRPQASRYCGLAPSC